MCIPADADAFAHTRQCMHNFWLEFLIIFDKSVCWLLVIVAGGYCGDYGEEDARQRDFVNY